MSNPIEIALCTKQFSAFYSDLKVERLLSSLLYHVYVYIVQPPTFLHYHRLKDFSYKNQNAMILMYVAMFEFAITIKTDETDEPVPYNKHNTVQFGNT